MEKKGMEPTLLSVLEKPTLQWIFVGGKGGVGKTTVASSFAIQLAARREAVLIISTDPAHNLSDAFDQKFSSKPTQIKGFKNLYGMEIDPQMSMDSINIGGIVGPENAETYKGVMGELASAVPGIDEAASFAEVIGLIKTYNFSAVVFDTAPTGHTLRLLNLPNVIEKGLEKIVVLKEKFGGMLTSVAALMDPQTSHAMLQKMFDYLETMKKMIEEVNAQFKNPDLTTFIAVCIPEFLSLYETERLVTELENFQIHIGNLVINQVLFPEPGAPCKLCMARTKMQKKYLDMFVELYTSFHLVVTPLLEEEVRGTEKLQAFSENLVKPYMPPSGAKQG